MPASNVTLNPDGSLRTAKTDVSAAMEQFVKGQGGFDSARHAIEEDETLEIVRLCDGSSQKALALLDHREKESKRG